MANNTTLNVNFIKDDLTLIQETAVLEDEITLLLDTEKNNDETEFNIGSDAFVKVVPSGDNTDIFLTNIGTVQKIGTNIPWIIFDEEVRFIYEDTGNLAYAPSGIVSYSWVGRNGGNPKFNGRNIILNEPVVGVLRCTYTTFFDRLRVTYSGPEETDLLLVGLRDETKASLIIQFVGTGAPGAKKDVTINVKDYCNDDTVPYANVTVWGVDFIRETKVANAEGQVIFEQLTVGNTYNLSITAPGYRDSVDDSLDNASFTVS